MRNCDSRRIIFAGLGALLASGPMATANGLAQSIERIVQNAERGSAHCSLAVIDLERHELIQSHNAHDSMIPASNQKLFVLAAAVDVLGPSFEFRTVLAIRGQDLIVVGDGDPATGDPQLCSARNLSVTSFLDDWALAVRRVGGPVIDGDLIIDDSIFDSEWTNPTWELNDLQKWYAAPVGALNLNDNCLEFSLKPSSSPGGRGEWSAFPRVSIVDVVNRTRTAQRGDPVVARPENSWTYILSGPCSAPAKLQPVAVPEPSMFFAEAFRESLDRAGVALRGHIRRQRVRSADGSLPVDLRIIADHRTALSDVLARIGKNSQNLFAECLVKRLGYEFAKRSVAAEPQGSWQTGADAVQDFLRRAGIRLDGFSLADASGLSRANRATAAQFIAVLTYMHQHPHRSLFFESLAVAGEYGSLRRRMVDLEDRVVGKTGTLRGVKSLSGYIHDRGTPSLAFSILINGIKGSSAAHKQAQDELCRLLASAKRNQLP